MPTVTADALSAGDGRDEGSALQQVGNGLQPPSLYLFLLSSSGYGQAAQLKLLGDVPENVRIGFFQ